MKKILFIDGIGDYSIVQNQYRKNSPDYTLLSVIDILKTYFICEYFDVRENQNSKSKVYDKVNSFQPDYTFIKSTSENINNIKNLDILNLKVGESYLVSNNSAFNNVHNKNFLQIKTIIIREDCDIQTNVFEFYKVLNINCSNDERIDLLPWRTLNNFENKAISLNCGCGCKRNCSFCSIKGTDCSYISVDQFFKEVDYLFSKDVKYFHLNNHNISYNFAFLKDICKKLIQNYKQQDYIWSCCLIPEQLAKNPEIIKLLKESKCEIIDLLVYSIDSEVLKYLKIKQTKEEIKEITIKLYSEGITSIIVNYIFGFPYETENTYEELLEFSTSLVKNAPGSVEFNLVHLNKSYTLLGDLKNIETSRNELSIAKEYYYSFRSTFYSKIYEEMKCSIYKMKQEHRISHCSNFNKKFTSQYFIYFISKTSSFTIHGIVKGNKALKFLRGIKSEEIGDYCPVCYALPLQSENKISLGIDPLLLEMGVNNILELDEFEEELYRFSREYVTLQDIFNYAKNRKKISENLAMKEVLEFYSKLEKFDLLYFTKVL